MGIRLTPDEAWDVISRSHTGILTTLRADGSPVTLPTWFVVLDRSVCFSTPSQTKKVSRLRRDPRAAFLVESGRRWAELRAVHLSGLIDVVDDDEAKVRIREALDEKYAAFRTSETAMPEATRDHYATRTFFRLTPGPRMLTWDNSRIAVASPG
ncbi:MAG TPA: pyridoxamine 5'-phosphate oxidase family protein [Acidimicrobiales bacterium]|nr:pyridoxamine 5'-phosphate oxidase family protein [Acidimicrobiales bacterium]